MATVLPVLAVCRYPRSWASAKLSLAQRMPWTGRAPAPGPQAGFKATLLVSLSFQAGLAVCGNADSTLATGRRGRAARAPGRKVTLGRCGRIMFHGWKPEFASEPQLPPLDSKTESESDSASISDDRDVTGCQCQ